MFESIILVMWWFKINYLNINKRIIYNSIKKYELYFLISKWISLNCLFFESFQCSTPIFWSGDLTTPSWRRRWNSFTRGPRRDAAQTPFFAPFLWFPIGKRKVTNFSRTQGWGDLPRHSRVPLSQLSSRMARLRNSYH